MSGTSGRAVAGPELQGHRWLIWFGLPGWSASTLQWRGRCLGGGPENLRGWPPHGPCHGSQSDRRDQKRITGPRTSCILLFHPKFGGIIVGTELVCASRLVFVLLIGVMWTFLRPSVTVVCIVILVFFFCHLITSLISLAAWVAFLMSGRSATVV